MFGEIEGNKQGLVPIESVVQYLRMVSRDNRKIKVKIKIGTLIEDYEDVDIDIKIFTVGVTNITQIPCLCCLARRSCGVWRSAGGSPTTRMTPA